MRGRSRSSRVRMERLLKRDGDDDSASFSDVRGPRGGTIQCEIMCAKHEGYAEACGGEEVFRLKKDGVCRGGRRHYTTLCNHVIYRPTAVSTVYYTKA